MHFRFTLETRATPEQVFGAFTDFSARRVHTWQKTLDPGKYRVLESGDTWAIAREGSSGTNIWVVLRYEWPEPGTVHWTLVESSYCDGGSGDISIVARDGGGSRVDVDIDHTDPRGWRGTAILLLQRLLGPVLFPRLWKAALDRVADEAPGVG